MGFKTFGFGFGREDVWEPEEIFWGPEDTWLGDERYSGDRELSGPLGAVQMGLIYVNPEGPNGNPDPLAAARDIRETFRRMAMNDEETVALIAGGHTFGKTHGAGNADLVGPEPEGCADRAAGPRLEERATAPARAPTPSPAASRCTWTPTPTQVGQRLLRDPVRLRVGADREPGRREAVGGEGRRGRPCPARHDPATKRKPTMLTTDLALRVDPVVRARSRGASSRTPTSSRTRSRKAWYKLLHRDMGPVSRYLGPWVPEPQLWQDPVPAADHALIGDGDVADAEGQAARRRGCRSRSWSRTAWASAASFRGTDKRGGANGARIRLAPQKDWEVNEPAELATVLQALEQVQQDSTARRPAARRSRSPT